MYHAYHKDFSPGELKQIRNDNPSPCIDYIKYSDLNVHAGIIPVNSIREKVAARPDEGMRLRHQPVQCVTYGSPSPRG